VPKVVKGFKGTFLFSIGSIAIMVIFACGNFIPYDWRINDFVALLPMGTIGASHFLLPIALNPALMTFTF